MPDAMRFNKDKARMELLPMFALEGAADVLAMGAEKYEAWNWTLGASWGEQVGCLLRHLAAIQAGELYDRESGKLHSDHIIVNAIFLSYNINNFPEKNDLAEIPRVLEQRMRKFSESMKEVGRDQAAAMKGWEVNEPRQKSDC